VLSNRGTTKPSIGHSKKLSLAAKHRRVTSLDMKSIADHQAAQGQAYQDDPRYKEYLSLHQSRNFNGNNDSLTEHAKNVGHGSTVKIQPGMV
jgi:hypothetical protein